MGYQSACSGSHILGTQYVFMVMMFGQIIKKMSCGIEQSLGNIFCKGPDSKYFRLWASYSLCYKYLTLVVTAWKQPKTMNKQKSVAVFQ